MKRQSNQQLAASRREVVRLAGPAHTRPPQAATTGHMGMALGPSANGALKPQSDVGASSQPTVSPEIFPPTTHEWKVRDDAQYAGVMHDLCTIYAKLCTIYAPFMHVMHR